jgi:hypothetical protein
MSTCIQAINVVVQGMQASDDNVWPQCLKDEMVEMVELQNHAKDAAVLSVAKFHQQMMLPNTIYFTFVVMH